nr:ribonuclease H-like domain-containing protein [Tanacetum cinerariifolium]
MEQYLTFTDHALWEVIVNGDSVSSVASASSEDLEHIDTDDLKEMDLKWQVAMLTMRVKRFIKKIGRKLDLNGKDIVGFDRTKVECYNCHRRGHFARECKAPKNQGNRNRDSPTRNAPVDTSTTNALYDQQREALNKSNLEIIDKTGLGYDGHVNKSEVLNNVVNSCESDEDDNQESDCEDENVFKPKEVKKIVKPILEKIEYVNARNTTVENEIKAEKPRKFSQSPRDNSVFKSKMSNITSVPKIEINASKTSKDSLEKPKTVRYSASIIEDWESDSELENVFEPKE